MSRSLAQLLLIQREFMTLHLLLWNKVFEPFPICALNCSLTYKHLVMIHTQYLLAILFNTYLLAKMVKYRLGMQLESCLLRISL